MAKKKLDGLRKLVNDVLEAGDDWDHPDYAKYEEVLYCLWRDYYFEKDHGYSDVKEFDKFLKEHHIVLSKVNEGRDGYDEYGQFEVSIVYRFANKAEECFVKFVGWSSSDASCSELSDWFFVKPVSKTVTVYEKE